MQYPVFKEQIIKQPYGCSPGNVLLSRLPAEQVPSALEGLTAVFGMGTGVSPPPSSPDYMKECSFKTEQRMLRYGHISIERR